MAEVIVIVLTAAIVFLTLVVCYFIDQVITAINIIKMNKRENNSKK